MDEFGLIARYLTPLAGEGALGLGDDVAVLDGLALTHDTIVQGTHFLPDDPLESVGWKAVAVNASDLIAKGCAPTAMLVGTTWPKGADEAGFAALARGLGEASEAYGAALLGGDTTRHRGEGPLTIGVTMLGRPLGGGIVPRGGARPGDRLFVGGPIGDAHVGLLVRQGRAAIDHADEAVEAYRRPCPPLAAAALVAEHASAAIDVSDGLVTDAGHLAWASGVRVRLRDETVPLSRAGRAYLASGGTRDALWTGGDDYVPLITVPTERAASLESMPGFSEVGLCEAGEGVVLERGGVDHAPPRGGYAHF